MLLYSIHIHCRNYSYFGHFATGGDSIGDSIITNTITTNSTTIICKYAMVTKVVLTKTKYTTTHRLRHHVAICVAHIVPVSKVESVLMYFILYMGKCSKISIEICNEEVQVYESQIQNILSKPQPNLNTRLGLTI